MIYKTEMITVDELATFPADTLAGIKTWCADTARGTCLKQVECTVETASVRFWSDGSVPTSSEGHLISKSGHFIVLGVDAPKFKVINVSGASKLAVSYEV